jgi:hypothetical protein
MRITPSATSSGIAGMGLWILARLCALKLDSLAKLFHCQRFLNWIAGHKSIAFMRQALMKSSKPRKPRSAGSCGSNAYLYVMGGLFGLPTMPFLCLVPDSATHPPFQFEKGVLTLKGLA